VWGWQYIYGSNPLSEARKAIQRVNELKLDGFVVDAELEFEQPGKDIAARKYMSELRNALPGIPIGISSYRFPSYHREFPYQEFLDYSDYVMPQVYWEQSHNPETQMIRTVREFQNIGCTLPIIPTGSAYSTGAWAATPEDATAFLHVCKKELGIKAANFWVWEFTRSQLRPVWQAIQNYPWDSGPPPKDISELYIDALNNHDLVGLIGLYAPHGVCINFQRTVQGEEGILTWYHTFLNDIFPDASFKLTSVSGTDSSRHLNWTGTSSIGQILNGSDTIGLIDGKISYHYTYFTITHA